VLCRHVERFEVVVIVFRFRTVEDLEAQTPEDSLDLLADRGQRVPVAEPNLTSQRAAETELVLFGPPPQNYVFVHSGDSWARLGVVADVPTDADVIVLGVSVWNRGHAWIDDARLTKVATSARPTNNPLRGERFTMPLAHVRPFDAPTNLDFEATNLDSAGLPSELVGC
jgi:hypothetical protein